MIKFDVVSLYNYERWFYLHKMKPIAHIIYRLIRVIHAADIPYTVAIGKNIKFLHNGLGVVLHENAVIGDNVTICQNVTLGGRDVRGGQLHIGNNVLIGTGAILIGSLSIGDNVKIGANSVVLESVPPNCTVVGVPAKVVKVHSYT